MDVGVEVGAVVVADGVGGDPFAHGRVVEAASEVDEAGFGVEALGGEAPGSEGLEELGAVGAVALVGGGVAVEIEKDGDTACEIVNVGERLTV